MNNNKWSHRRVGSHTYPSDLKYVVPYEIVSAITREVEDKLFDRNAFHRMDDDGRCQIQLEHAIETATDFLTIDELIADYEEYAEYKEASLCSNK